MIFTVVVVIALLVFLMIAYQGGFAPPALIRGAITALVIVLVGYLLLLVIPIGAR